MKYFQGAAALMIAGFISPASQACAVCFGRSDSDLAKGMNMGILALLIVVVSVLGSIAATGIYLARRASRVAQAASQTKNFSA